MALRSGLGAWLFLGLLLAWVGASPAAAQGQAKAVVVASGLSSPIFAAAPRGDTRLFIVERAGRIRIVTNGVTQATPFLDISGRVRTTGEGGLLGLAFPRDFATSGLFVVYYTDSNLDSVVSRFSLSADPAVADANSEEVLLFIDQPDGLTNHKGGTIHYGPDGFLWFATGDGGGSYDPNENAQDPQSLLGKMLRVDVGPVFAPGSIPVASEVYRIPADNPFVGSAPRDEIWAFGLRNPFRWSFDRKQGDVWIGDVGQGSREEVNFEPASDPGGRNYGWDVMEGTLCGLSDPAPSPPCNDPSLTLPLLEYDHSGGNCSIIGGNVYRFGTSVLSGLYFFGDYCTGKIWSLDPATLAVTDRTVELGAAAGVGFALVAFGENGNGVTLVVHRGGTVFEIQPAIPPPPGCGLGPELVPALAGLLAARRVLRARRRPEERAPCACDAA